MCLAKTKALISFAVTAKLICVFVVAYTKIRFSHDAARIISPFSLSAITSICSRAVWSMHTCSETLKTSILVTRIDYCLDFVYFLLIIESKIR